MTKKLEEIQKRHAQIKSLITSQEIFNQTQLVKVLKQKGIKATQATLSRDLNELGVVRIPTANGLVYKLSATGEENTLQKRIPVVHRALQYFLTEKTIWKFSALLPETTRLL